MSVLDFNFSCLSNVSKDSLSEYAWSTYVPEDTSTDTVSNGYASATISLLFLLIGLPWNLLVAITILRKKLYKVSAVLLLLNLAISNIMVCLLSLPFVIITGYSEIFLFGSTDETRCRVCQIGVVNIALPLVSIFTTSLLSIDRLLYLKIPLKYYTFVTPTRVFLSILAVWLLCFVVSLPPLFGFGSVGFAYVVTACVPAVIGSNHIVPNYYYMLLVLAVSLVPMVSLFVAYIWILCTTNKHLLKRAKNMQLPGSLKNADEIMKELHRKQFRMVQLFGAIFTANLITWTPIAALILTGAIVGSGHIPTLFYNFAYLSYLSAIVIHPIIELILIREIKEEVVRLCCNKVTKRRAKITVFTTANNKGSRSSEESPHYRLD